MLNIHMLGKGASLRHIRIRVCQVKATVSGEWVFLRMVSWNTQWNVKTLRHRSLGKVQRVKGVNANASWDQRRDRFSGDDVSLFHMKTDGFESFFLVLHYVFDFSRYKIKWSGDNKRIILCRISFPSTFHVLSRKFGLLFGQCMRSLCTVES